MQPDKKMKKFMSEEVQWPLSKTFHKYYAHGYRGLLTNTILDLDLDKYAFITQLEVCVVFWGVLTGAMFSALIHTPR